MLNIVKNFFNTKSVTSKRESPSERLCDDIQRDYWRDDGEGNLRLFHRKGFLDKQFFINGNKYNVVPQSPTNDSFELMVKDESNKTVFYARILYGPCVTNHDCHILYIDDFCRKTPYRQDVGKEMAKYIRELAENRGFTIIGVHIVAQPNLYEDAMSDEQLKVFYNNYLNGENVKFESMENSDYVGSVDWKQ